MAWDIWLIFLVLGIVVPWRGYARLRELLAKPQIRSRERLSLYLSTILFQWLAAAVAAWRAWAHGFTARQLGLSWDPGSKIAVWAVFGAAILASFQWLNLRRVSRLKPDSRGQLQTLADRILPRSGLEGTIFFALAATAAICEEFLYRGFAIAVLARAGLPAWVIVLGSAVLFGLAHLYQGRGGLVSTAALGLLFGVARLSWQSLIPVVAWHLAVDVVAGVAGPKYLIKRENPEVEVPA